MGGPAFQRLFPARDVDNVARDACELRTHSRERRVFNVSGLGEHTWGGKQQVHSSASVGACDGDTEKVETEGGGCFVDLDPTKQICRTSADVAPFDDCPSPSGRSQSFYEASPIAAPARPEGETKVSHPTSRHNPLCSSHTLRYRSVGQGRRERQHG